MHLNPPFRSAGAFSVLVYSLLAWTVSAVRVIESTSLEDCSDTTNITASLFNVIFTPDNHTVVLNAVGNSYIEGNITLKVEATVYGYTAVTETVDPCTLGLQSLCPLTIIPLNFDVTYSNLSSSVINRIPAIAYGIPDLDAVITVYVATVENPNVTLACVRSRLSNGQTVHHAGVGWATAIVAGIGLLTSGLVSGLGHYNTASHIAVYALSLFNYFQAMAIIGLCAVPLPPIVQAWTQDFSWSLGIIRVGFLQRLATWYQISTGGSSDTLLETLSSKSVQVVKRSIGLIRKAHSLSPRAHHDDVTSDGEYLVKGIKRVAFLANIASTNIFLTSIIFLCIFIGLTWLIVTLVKYVCDFSIRKEWMDGQRFQNLRDNYHVALKGILFRSLLIAYPPMTILCLWEFTQVDSIAEVVLAVLVFFGISAALGLAVVRVIQMARRSEQLHRTAAYMLYSNATVLNKHGFLYIQYRASAYYFIIPSLVHFILKSMFVAFAQESGNSQAIGLIIIEAVMLMSASVIRPWMDKPTNVINISICAVNFLNAIFLLIFTGIFGGPGLIVGVSGVVFFVANAVFVLVLLIFVLVAATYSFIQKNPDTRYEAINDNRASFIKSQTAFSNMELDALGVTARSEGGMKDGYGHREMSNFSMAEPMHSPVSPSIPFFNDDNDRSISNLSSHRTHFEEPYSESRLPPTSGPWMPSSGAQSHSSASRPATSGPRQPGTGYQNQNSAGLRPSTAGPWNPSHR